MPRDLTISIINHSNPEMLRDCLRSIYAGSDGLSFEVRVVDNATGGRLVDDIRAEFPDVVWLFNDQRRGFAANHNQVLSSARSRYVCILNDDTIVHRGAMTAMVRHMDENPALAMTGPRTLNRDGSIQNSAFRDKSLVGELVNLCLLPGKLNQIKLAGIDPAQFQDRPAEVDWLLGACIMVREAALAAVGLLDDVLSPVANCEEVDWCLRARQAGWRVALVPAAVITHFGGQSMKPQSAGPDRFRVEMHRAILAYFRKHHGIGGELPLRVIYVATLPWNGLMLSQSVLRRRMTRNEARSIWATKVGIATVGLRPLPRPYCRPMPVAAPSSPRVGRRHTNAVKTLPANFET